MDQQRLIVGIMNNNKTEFEDCILVLEDVNFKEEMTNRTPLIIAAMFGNVFFMERLFFEFENHINVNEQDIFGKTALHYAVEIGSLEAVKNLLIHGTDVTIQDKRKSTFMDWIRCPDIKRLPIRDYYHEFIK